MNAAPQYLKNWKPEKGQVVLIKVLPKKHSITQNNLVSETCSGALVTGKHVSSSSVKIRLF